METLRYGDDPSQLLELTRPSGTSRGLVVVIHGGFWRSAYDLDLGRPLAASLAEEGWTAANLEYRRVGNGGGWPETFDDVEAGIAAAVEAVSNETGPSESVVLLGHSAGGHLAVWAAGQPGSPATAAISQAGVLDLERAIRDDLGGGAVQALLGADLSAHLRDADPLAAVPLGVPVRCVHGDTDQNVPIDQSTSYVEAATQAGGDATLTRVEGDHFVLIDPSSPAWATQLEILAELT